MFIIHENRSAASRLSVTIKRSCCEQFRGLARTVGVVSNQSHRTFAKDTAEDDRGRAGPGNRPGGRAVFEILGAAASQGLGVID